MTNNYHNVVEMIYKYSTLTQIQKHISHIKQDAWLLLLLLNIQCMPAEMEHMFKINISIYIDR